MTIIVKHSFSGKESLQNALINLLVSRMEQIGSVETADDKVYDGVAQNETDTENMKEGVAS